MLFYLEFNVNLWWKKYMLQFYLEISKSPNTHKKLIHHVLMYYVNYETWNYTTFVLNNFSLDG